MARQIIILERTEQGFGVVELRAAFWFTVTLANAAPRPGMQSAVKGADAPQPAELTALQDGLTIEVVGSWRLPLTYNNASIRTFLETCYAAGQSAVTTSPPGQYYGSNWDGTTWGNGS